MLSWVDTGKNIEEKDYEKSHLSWKKNGFTFYKDNNPKFRHSTQLWNANPQ